MPPEMAGAVAEAGTGSESTEPIESAGEVIEGSESGAETEGSESAETQRVEKPGVTKTRANLETLSSAKKEALKAIDPSLPGLIRDAVFAQKTLQREFPGGLKEAVALRDTFEAAGGEAGIRETQEAIADYGRLEQWFEAGDKQFVERLAEASPESFSAMMTPGLETWRAKDPEMYTHVMAKVMMNTLGPQVTQTLRQAYDLIAADKANGAAANAIADLHDKLLGLGQAAGKQPERKVDPNKTALSQREQELSQREMKANLSPVRSEGLRQIESVTDSEMNRSYQWSDTDPDVQEAVRNEVRQRLIKLSKKDVNFTDNYNKLVERQDWAGLKRHVSRFQAKVLPGIVSQAARLFNVKAKGTAKPAVKGAATTTAKPAEQGWVRVSAAPNIKEIDRAKTNEDMIYEGKAVLKSGKKVTWG